MKTKLKTILILIILFNVIDSDFFAQKFSKISLKEAFSTDRLAYGFEVLRSSTISYEGNYIGMYFVDPFGKTYKYKLLKIDETGYTEIKLEGETSPIEYFDNSIGFSKDSKQFYSLTTNMEVYIWSTETGELLKKLVGRKSKDAKSPYAFIANGIFSYDKKTDVVYSSGFIIYDNKLYKFNDIVTEPFKSCATVVKLKTSPTVIVFSNDNQLIAVTGLFSKKTNIYDTRTGQNKIELHSIKKAINAIAFSADNEDLLISEKFAMSKNNVSSSESTTLFPINKSCFTMNVNCFNILAYSVVPSNTGQLYDLTNNKVLIDLPKLFKLTYEFIFSYDGMKLYAIDARGRIKCYKIIYE